DPELYREVSSLLASHSELQSGFLEQQVKGAVVAMFDETNPTVAERRIGPYRLIRELGQGGMGTVYLAERDDEHYQSSVAIKLIRPGMDTDFILARFKRERQILAHLKHVNIPRLLDGGTTEDRMPYLVMEYIEGCWITEYCQLYSLGIEQKLKLFIDVCSAVECAHRNFVVHRDLKPGNILVDSHGVAKLLDFGICKLLHADPMSSGETMAAMLTPDYASPEQIKGDPVTIASDVYSLGAVLYELLTGQRPHRIERYTPAEVERAICVDDTAQPSSVAREPAVARKLVGDLDNIVLRALEKTPERRYPTAAAFAADIQRYLDHIPVVARAQTIRYRAMRFAQRHSVGLLATAAVAVAMIAGTVISVRQARLAEYRLQLVRGLANKFVFEVHDAVAPLPGSTKARELIFKTGIEYLDALSKNARGDTQLESELADAYLRIGDVQGNGSSANLGNSKMALASYEKAKALLDAAIKKRPEDAAIAKARTSAYRKIGNIYEETRSLPEALVNYEEALSLGEPLLRLDKSAAIRAVLSNVHLDVSRINRNFGRAEKARDHAKAALALSKEAIALQPGDLTMQQSISSAHSALGMAEATLNRLPEALAEYRLSVAKIEELLAGRPNDTSLQRGLMLAYGHVGDVLGYPPLQNLGDTEGAIAAYEKVAGLARTIYERDLADLRATTDYGIALSRLAAVIPRSEAKRKLEVQRRSIKILSDGAKVDPANTVFGMYLGVMYEEEGDSLESEGDLAGAMRAWRQSAAFADRFMRRRQPAVMYTAVSVHRKLGALAARASRGAAAVAHAQIALHVGSDAKDGSTGATTLLPRRAAAVGGIYAALARSPVKQDGDREEARKWLSESVKLWNEAKNKPGFGKPHARMLKEVETALVELTSK
ncbi:MAG: serine/threonine-protein kinase, partial [Bryobacteraceae bacterium]